jgi:hypothetical protein
MCGKSTMLVASFEMLPFGVIRAGFFVRKCLACALVNIFELEWGVVRLEGVCGEETGPKNITIARMKAIPELDVAFIFCQVERENEGVGVVYKRIVVL